MGGCFSKKKKKTSSSNNNNVVKPADPQLNHLKPAPQNVIKKEVFVIKHRISHELDKHSDQCDIPEEVKLIRSKSTGTQNPNQRRKRRYSRSKRSFDFDLNTRINNANQVYDDDALDRHTEFTVSTRTSSSTRREQRRRSGSKERRISISPSRRSQSPSPSPSPSLRNLNTSGSSSSKPPAKMVSVPATRKSDNAVGEQGVVKRIHVKRNVSPVRRTNFCVYNETQQEDTNTRVVANQRRKSLVEIDNNATPSNAKITPTYASLLLEDIQNFHQKNTNRPSATPPPAFAVPECVNKAYSIMEAVADLNSNTRWRNPTAIKKDTPDPAVIHVQECRKPDSTPETESAK